MQIFDAQGVAVIKGNMHRLRTKTFAERFQEHMLVLPLDACKLPSGNLASGSSQALLKLM